MRLAWFTPLPPVRSGIADYSAEVLPRLAVPSDDAWTDPRRGRTIDVFVGSDAELNWAAPGDVRVQPAHDFVWRHHVQPYDLVVYQLGNAWCHDYMWPYVFRWPGLVVLHDGQLHHARAWSLLQRRRRQEYRAELAFDQPDVPPEASEIALSGFGGAIYYFWPMLRAVLASARGVAVHSPGLIRQIDERYEPTRLHYMPMGVSDPLAGGLDRDGGLTRRSVRARHGIAPDAFVVAAFGGITPEKRIAEGIAAVAAIRRARRDVHLLLVGASVPHLDAPALATAAGIADRLTVTGYVSDSALPGYLAAADAALCLRWPTTGETSASWLRAIAAGLPTVITDLAHQSDLPVLDPRTWNVAHTSMALKPPPPIAIAVDILDEEHSLRLALRRLATDADLCADLGRAARAHYEQRHTLEAMADAYRGVMATARAAPAPDSALPTHLRPDPLAHARELLAPFAIDPESLRLSP